MTKKLKKISLFTLLGLLVFSFLNCEYDKNEDVNIVKTTPTNLKVQKVGYLELSKNKNLFQKLDKLKTDKTIAKDINGKVVYSIDYDFYIETNYANYIEEENGKHSYTFQIFRENTTYLLENLVLNANDSLGYDLYIAQYDVTPTELEQIKSGVAVNLSQKTMLISIDDNALVGNIFNKVVNIGNGDCLIDYTYIPGTSCSGDEHHSFGANGCIPNDATPEQFIYTWGECPTGSGGGGSSSTGGGDYHQGGGGNTTTDPTVNTTPLINPTEMDAPTPCDKILKLQADTNFKLRMSGLIEPARNYTREVVTVVNENPNPIPTNNYTYETFAGTVQSTTAEFRIYTNSAGYIHSHYNDLGSVFSAGDLQYLYLLLKNNPTSFDDIFLGLVTASNTAYLLLIENRAAFIAFGDKYLADKKKLDNFIQEKMYNKYDIHQDSSNQTNEDGFLEMMSDLNIGISLASSHFNTTDAPSPDLFNSWTKLKWDKNLNKKTTSKCK
jgi:hypothetical protein